jgi:hypothetical protein
VSAQTVRLDPQDFPQDFVGLRRSVANNCERNLAEKLIIYNALNVMQRTVANVGEQGFWRRAPAIENNAI